MSSAVAPGAELVEAVTRVSPQPGAYTFALASNADDAEIRRLLREHALPGAISLSFEREPDASLSASIEGDVHQTLIACARGTGAIAGLAARSVRTAFVNGQPRRLGYLGQLRVVRGRHGLRSLMDEGFAFCRTLHEDGDAPAYLVSVVADNDAARRLLIERRSATAPHFRPVGPMATFVIPTRRTTFAWRGGVERGSAAMIGEIASCLQRNLCRYQFAPSWTAADLASDLSTRDLAPEDFAIALDGGRVIGCAALWDQRRFKQVVVRGYAPALRYTRPFVNIAAHLVGLPTLPSAGEALQFAYLSHVAADDDRVDVLDALVALQVAQARDAGLDYVVAGFPERHPFHALIQQRWARRTYRSMLYLAYWANGEAFARSLDDRPAQPEVAVL